MRLLVYIFCHFLFVINVSALNYSYFTQKQLTAPEYTENNVDKLIKSSSDEYDKGNFRDAASKLLKIVMYDKEEPRSTHYFITVMNYLGCIDVYDEIYGLSNDAVLKLKKFKGDIEGLAKILEQIKSDKECCHLFE